MSNLELRCCPICGSSAVDFSDLTGGYASCASCRWVGTEMELLTVPTEGFDANQRASELFLDIRGVVAKEAGLPLLRLLIKWGFLDADPEDLTNTVDRVQFSAYLAAVAAGMMKAVMETRRSLVTVKDPYGKS